MQHHPQTWSMVPQVQSHQQRFPAARTAATRSLLILHYLLMNTRSPKSTARVIRSSVKDMLAEARKILKAGQQLPVSRKIVLPSPEDSPLHSLSALCSQKNRLKDDKLSKRHKESLSKNRLSALLNENCPSKISQKNSKNKMYNPLKGMMQQIKYQTLNQDQAELVLSSGSALPKTAKYEEQLKARHQDRSYAVDHPLSISVDGLENKEMFKLKRLRTIQSSSSSNLLFYLGKNRLKTNPFKAKRRLKSLHLSQRLQKCQPWPHFSQNDPVFQL